MAAELSVLCRARNVALRVLEFADNFPYVSDLTRKNYAKLYLDMRLYSKALELVEETDHAVDSKEQSLTRLSIYLEALQFDKYHILVSELLAKYPDDDGLLALLAHGYFRLGDHESAVKTAQKVKGAEKNEDKMRLLAKVHFYAGNLKEPLKISRAYAKDPGEKNSTYYSYYYFILAAGKMKEAMALLRARRAPAMRKALQNLPSAHDLDSLNGKRIYLIPEQGIGDRVEFARYNSDVAKAGIIAHTRNGPNLRRLFANMDNPPIDTGGKVDPNELDAYVYAAELPALLNYTKKDQLRGTEPYLHAEAPFVKRWSERLDSSKPLIGINWKGSDMGSHDFNRSMPLKALLPLLMRQDVTVVSLQIGKALSQIDELDPAHRPLVFDDLDSGPDAYVDTVGLISNLDLVVSTDTSMAHVAGAMGAKTAVLLGAYPDLRWLQDEQQDFLYRNQTLIRQTSFGNWASCMPPLMKMVDKIIKEKD